MGIPKADLDHYAVSIETSSPLNNTNIRQRNFSELSGIGRRSNTLPFQFASATKQWRWHNLIAIAVAGLFCLELVLFLVSTTLLNYADEPVRFDIKHYPKINYLPLDKTTPIMLAPHSTVYHVTKEFGPATMGGMGTVLTAITQAQLRTGKITPYVVLPFYSFLRRQEQYPIKRTTTLIINVHNDDGKLVPVGFPVSEFKYDFHPISNFEKLSNEEKLFIKSQKKQTVTVYLIDRGSLTPFTRAFKAYKITEIYSSAKGLPQEWKDQYFDKAAAAFIAWKAAGRQEQSLFAPLGYTPRVDIVHLHGATNAYVAKFLKDYEEQMGPVPPAIVYTMHDYLDELQYTNTIPNTKKFLSRSDNENEINKDIMPYTFGSNKVFMSPLAIDKADAVTFVSETMAKDMVEGKLNFYMKEVVMNSLLKQAENQKFYGISNGLDYSGAINPFTESRMATTNLTYPEYARSIIEQKLERVKDGIDQITDPTSAISAYYWAFSTDNRDYVVEAKKMAKQYLVDQQYLDTSDLDRPLVLFVGRFQYNKGLETFEAAANLFKKHNMKFAIIGQPNNYPLAWVEKLAARYPENIVLISTLEQQKNWLIYFRAAADFVYVPSVTESFGLVAAEGLMFGSSVISTGTGGLSEFLIDRSVDDNAPSQVVSSNYIESRYISNAYLFGASTSSLATAVERAMADYDHIRQSMILHEEYVLRMMLSAYSLGWERSGKEQGPVYDYLRVYQQVIQNKKAKSKFDLDNV
ncbi:putative glycogen synthase 2 [Choanephora cucurbitarum]|uniref:Putative glycogen synthase 2 n=1 Tax=Choanephora cucurbitarum TaxID=101091 RepID=A0A1C7NAY8_9FUNG|nr:putative glycogen synthase 2 [Choanephora cucurbitarum]